jgi:hypothetical protein
MSECVHVRLGQRFFDFRIFNTRTVTLLGVVGQHRAEVYRQDAKDAKQL